VQVGGRDEEPAQRYPVGQGAGGPPQRLQRGTGTVAIAYDPRRHGRHLDQQPGGHRAGPRQAQRPVGVHRRLVEVAGPAHEREQCRTAFHTVPPGRLAAMRSPADVAAFAVVAVGGALGSAARYGVSLVLPHDPATGLPWATLTVNAVGCLLIGVLSVAVETFAPHRLVRPFVGVGVLGGFTTFSTWAVEVQETLARGDVAGGLGYLALTLAVAFAAVAVGVAGARRVLSGRSAA